MKKLLSLILILAMVPVIALGDLPDISGLSYNELVELKNKINLAMWNSQEWQEVTVPPGIYEIGKDIPAGHWSIKAYPGCGPDLVVYSSGLSNDGHDIDYGDFIMESVCDPGAPFYSQEYKTVVDFKFENGHYVRLDCAMIFTPYTGKPDLGFK